MPDPGRKFYSPGESSVPNEVEGNVADGRRGEFKSSWTECFVSRGRQLAGEAGKSDTPLAYNIKAPLGREKPAVAVTKITIRGQTSGEHLGIAAGGSRPVAVAH